MAKSVKGRIRDEEQRIEQQVAAHQPQLLRLGSAVMMFVIGVVVTAIALLSLRPSGAPSDLYAGGPGGGAGAGGGEGAAANAASFNPPAPADIPPGPEGDAIRRGMTIFNMTYAAPDSKPFVGNGMACTNCHLDSGRRANSAPMWAAWVSFPQYRKKNNKINTMADRIKGCFLYSMNAQNSPSGTAPPDDSTVYSDLQIYFAWLAKGAPQYGKLKGAGYVKLAAPAQPFDPARGAVVYNAKCASCHGPSGQGASMPNGAVVYPALWGPQSYNWGAGMAAVNNAAGFIKANMPFNQPGSLTDQEAWDVAAYIDSQERPKDPRQTGSIAANAAKNFAGSMTYYGKTLNGHVLGTGVTGAPHPKVPAIKPDGALGDPAIAAMGPASQGS